MSLTENSPNVFPVFVARPQADTPRSEGPAPPLRLAPQHFADLCRSALDGDTIEAAGLATIVDVEQIARQLNRPRLGWDPGPCLILPYFDRCGQATGYHRLKPDCPRADENGKAIKYEAPLGLPASVYFPPLASLIAALADPLQPLVITEGEKKTLAATQFGFPAIGVPGVDCWRAVEAADRKSARKGAGVPAALHPQLAELPWHGRTVYIAFDSDRATNLDVRRAEDELARALQAAGAFVRIVTLPPGPNGEKTGIDDFFARGGTRDEFASLLQSATEPFAENGSPRPAGLFVLRNYILGTASDDKGQSRPVRLPRAVHDIVNEIRQIAYGWPCHADGVGLFADDGRAIVTMSNAAQLSAWLESVAMGHRVRLGYHAMAPFGLVDQRIAALEWRRDSGLPSIGMLQVALEQQAHRFEAIQILPHYPPLASDYYHVPHLQGGNGTRLKELVGRFNPATPEDGALLTVLFMQLVWGGPFGRRPGWLIEGAEDDPKGGRGVGKTTLVSILELLVAPGVHVRRRGTDEQMFKRLLSEGARGARMIVLDNIKDGVLSSEEIEGLITQPYINGWRLYRGDGRVPNVFTVLVTGNGIRVSADLARRLIVLRLARPKFNHGWLTETTRLVTECRWEILGDLVAALRHEHNSVLNNSSSWPEWEVGVLSKLPNAEHLAGLIQQRSEAVNGDEDEAATVRMALISAAHYQPRGDNGQPVFTSIDLANLMTRALGRPITAVVAGRFVANNRTTIPELTPNRRAHGMEYIWTPVLPSTAGCP